jgi:hypothetical protein
MKTKVYIASPYSCGGTAVNVRRQIESAHELYQQGFTCHVPLLSHFEHMLFPKPYEFWLKNDLEWINVCDCMLRLPGDSIGADIEVSEFSKSGKPIFNSVEEVVNFYNK